MNKERIERELARLKEGGQVVELFVNGTSAVVYRSVPTSGDKHGLPTQTDVIVPVPPGYAASPIDLAGLPLGSPLLPRLKGGGNNQGVLNVAGQQWQLASYHPHNGGGGPPWDQIKHGFHTYLDHLIAWLHQIS